MDSVLTNISAGALESARSAILITDARGPDRPIVYMNPAFEHLTGYTEQEVLGRDCRFLQNDDTDQTAVHDIRKALEENRPIRSVLRNYRKDGSLFFNEIFINPIRDNAGEVSHFVGCQNGIEYPEAASLRDDAKNRYHELSTREREVFECVVRGYANKEIARIMDLSPRTVEKYRLRMLEKMQTKNLSLLIRYALAQGMIFEDA